MKQGRVFLQVILIIIAVTIVGLLAYSAYSGTRETLNTALIYEYEVGDGCTVEGYLVRSEELIGSAWPINVLSRKDGEKVGAGQLVARGYQTSDAKEQQEEAEALSQRLTQLEYAYSEPLSVSDKEALQSSLQENLQDWAVARETGSGDDDSLGSVIKGQTLRLYAEDDDRAKLSSQITEIQNRLIKLRQSISSGSNAVTVSGSGWFSSATDGYESILTPAGIQSMLVADLKELKPAELGKGLIGRLCTSERWYFVCAVPTDSLDHVDTGDTVTVTFSGVSGSAIEMDITRIGPDEDGQTLVAMTTRQFLARIISLRQQTAQVAFRRYTGLRVPKSAICYEDGKTGVYVVESSYAKWKPVIILYDAGESYVVKEDTSSTANLWAGDEVIVGNRDLYDGKVVR